MKAAVLFAAKTPLSIEEVAIDSPAPREILVRVAASGLCHSDYNYVSGMRDVVTPVVLGHEIAGIVEEVGADVTGVRVGDHVVTCAAQFCGHCATCLSGKSQLCADRPARHDGRPRLTLRGTTVTQFSQLAGFAEQVLVHEHAVVTIPRQMPLDRAALLGCGVLTGLGAVFNAARVHPGSSVVVIGCGGVGLNIVQGARIAGAERIVAVDRAAEKRALALEMGATDAFPGGREAVSEVRELTRGGADYTFEAIGLPGTMTQAVEMLAPGGLMTIVGAMPDDGIVALPGIAMLRNEWRVQGSFLGSSAFVRDIPRYAAMYLEGKLDLDRLIAERIALGEINHGFDAMHGGAQARSVIVFDDVINTVRAQ